MKTILVIEDENLIRTNIVKILEYTGFQVISAENGDEGIQLAKIHLPDLIICDIMMPGIDGYDVLDEVRHNSETAIIPFIFLSAKADRSDLRHGMDEGADDYITKPFTSDELIRSVTARLEKQNSITQPYVDEMRRTAINLNQLAFADPLTNLPNRILLHHRLLTSIQTAKHDNTLVSVLYFNLERLRDVNQTLGYAKGDELLQAIAERLRTALPDPNVVARLGGDEFAVLGANLDSREEVARLAQKVLLAVTEPYSLGDDRVQIHASMGISVYPDDGQSPDQLLTHAEIARRWCRTEQLRGYRFYHPSMTAVETERRKLEADLKGAIAGDELQLYYQPQVNLITRRMMGVEALVRWNHPTRGLVSPSKFIPIAEMAGLIVPINEWVLQEACSQLKAWQPLNLSPLKLAVNLSAHHLKRHNLAATITRTLEDTNFDPRLLILELSETSLMENIDTAIAILQDLTQLGIEISIDDFGTGFSSLKYLKHLPISSLKIDQSFISRVTDDEQDAAIASAIIAMAQSLNLKVIAEGVETQAQLDFLRKRGCYAIQGYLHSHPLPAPKFQDFLQSSQSRF